MKIFQAELFDSSLYLPAFSVSPPPHKGTSARPSNHTSISGFSWRSHRLQDAVFSKWCFQASRKGVASSAASLHSAGWHLFECSQSSPIPHSVSHTTALSQHNLFSYKITAPTATQYCTSSMRQLPLTSVTLFNVFEPGFNNGSSQA